MGLRVTRTCAGNPKEAVRLDMKVREEGTCFNLNLIMFEVKFSTNDTFLNAFF